MEALAHIAAAQARRVAATPPAVQAARTAWLDATKVAHTTGAADDFREVARTRQAYDFATAYAHQQRGLGQLSR